MSQRPSLSAANTSPAALNSTSSTGTPSRLPSSFASMMVTPLGSAPPACFCTSTLLPWLIAARSLPVGANALTISGVTWLTVLPLSDGVVWANAAAGTASATIAAARVLRMECPPCPVASAVGARRAMGWRRRHQTPQPGDHISAPMSADSCGSAGRRTGLSPGAKRCILRAGRPGPRAAK